jgi:hypothetical protein
MGATTVRVHKMDPSTMLQINTIGAGDGGRFTFTYQLRAGLSTNACRGITWSGESLWFCTDDQIALAARMSLLQVNPADGTLERILTISGTSGNYLDIAWNGRGFYAIVEGALGNTLVEIDSSGQVVRVINTSLALTETGIAFNEGSIYTTLYSSALAIRKRNPSTGDIEREVNVTGAIDQPHGIVFVGYTSAARARGADARGAFPESGYLIRKRVAPDDPLTYYTSYDPSLFTGIVRSTNRAPYSQGIERSNLAWDGAFLWDFVDDTAV